MAATLTMTDLHLTLGDGERQFHLSIGDFSLEQGRVSGLTGESGSGKTLFLELAGLLRAPGAGGAFLLHDGDAMADLGAAWRGAGAVARIARLRARNFGFVPQSGTLLPFLRVAENLDFAQSVAGRRDPARAARLLDRLGLGRLARAWPASLSIGQRQRAVIARALAHRPPFLIADEPTSALDPENADTVFALLLEAARDEGCGVLVASHDRAMVARHGIGCFSLAQDRSAASGHGTMVHARLTATAPGVDA